MLKKSIRLDLLLSAVLLATVGSASLVNLAIAQEFIPMAMSIPAPQQDACNSDPQTDGAASQTPVVLDRSGMDKASVHLQILQQTTTHFSDTAQAKKPATDDKKSPLKSQSNS